MKVSVLKVMFRMNYVCGKFSLGFKCCFCSFSSGNTVLLAQNIKCTLENSFICTAIVVYAAISVCFKMYSFNENKQNTTCL